MQHQIYAAFASMGREFQIGHLHINVVDVALRKQNAKITIPVAYTHLYVYKRQVLYWLLCWWLLMADNISSYLHLWL